MLANRIGIQFPLGQQVCLVQADLVGPQLVRTTIEVVSEFLNDTQVAFCSKLR